MTIWDAEAVREILIILTPGVNMSNRSESAQTSSKVIDPFLRFGLTRCFAGIVDATAEQRTGKGRLLEALDPAPQSVDSPAGTWGSSSAETDIMYTLRN